MALVLVAGCDDLFSLDPVADKPPLVVPRCTQSAEAIELPRRLDASLVAGAADFERDTSVLRVEPGRSAFAHFLTREDSYSAITLLLQVATQATGCSTGGDACESCPTSSPGTFVVDFVEPEQGDTIETACATAMFDGVSLVCVASHPPSLPFGIAFSVRSSQGSSGVFGSTAGTTTCGAAPAPRAIATCGTPSTERCGDGMTQMPREQCDDGNDIDTDTCTNACALAGCGDGAVNAGEQCDDGNDIDTDLCTNVCTNPRCGDGILNGSDQCDDANEVDTDACIACQAAKCGDGHVQFGVEQCDDGNTSDSDYCTNACTRSTGWGSGY